MAFFDDLSRKISQAGQNAVQKTKDMGDISRLNNLISEEEKKLNNNYYQIGKLYANTHKTDYEDAFATMISEITESEKRVEEYKKQIQEVKGLVVCEKCGAMVSKDVQFCSGCGNRMPAVAGTGTDPNMVKCIGCGNLVPKTMRFCTSCGKPVENSLKIQNTFADEQAPAMVCPSCGIAGDTGMLFCKKCGTRLVNTAQDSTANENTVEATNGETNPTVEDVTSVQETPVDEIIQVPETAVDETPVQESVEEVSEVETVEIPTPETVEAADEIPAENVVEAPDEVPAAIEDDVPEIVQVPTGRVCPSCGASAEDGMLFCIECGTRLESETASQAELPKNCPNCGKIAEPGMFFCIECGTKLK